MQIQLDIPDIKPAKMQNIHEREIHIDGEAGVIFTSIEVLTFLSQIFSYFCFLLPALRPCQGRLRKTKIKLRNGDGREIIHKKY